jgi:uncharacterized sporulation protein YeaH/YhbH (DUF444 family)
MTTIIDRRLNPKDKALRNRQKFIQRSKEQIKEAVKEAIDNGKITDIETDGKKTKIKVKGISEPTFGIDHKTGDKKYVLPGNKDYVVGDKSPKPKDGEGKGKTKGGLGEGEDDFEFVLNQDEFLDFIFEDLELPHLIKKQMKDMTKVKPKRAGFTNVGNPSQLDVVRSLKNSLGRRIGLGRPKDEEILELEEELKEAEQLGNDVLIQELQEKIKLLNRSSLVRSLRRTLSQLHTYTTANHKSSYVLCYGCIRFYGSKRERFSKTLFLFATFISKKKIHET